MPHERTACKHTVGTKHTTIPLVLEVSTAGDHPVAIGRGDPRVHIDLQDARGLGGDTIDLAVARKHATRPLAPARADLWANITAVWFSGEISKMYCDAYGMA